MLHGCGHGRRDHRLHRELRRSHLGDALHAHQCVQAHEGLLNTLKEGHVGIRHGLLPTGMGLHGLALRLLEGPQNTLVHGSGGLHAQASTWNVRGWGHALSHLNAWSCGHGDLAHDLDFLDHFDFANDLDLLHDDLGLDLWVGARQVCRSARGWVGLAHVGAVHVDGELGQHVLTGVSLDTEPVPEGGEGWRKASCDELSQAIIEAGQPGLAAAVQVDELGVLLGLQDAATQATEHGVRSDLDEGTDALLIHGFDLLDEANGARDLAREHLAHGRGVAWVRRSLTVGVDHHFWGGELHALQELSEGRDGGRDHLAVESRRDLEALTGQLSVREHLLGLLNGLGAAREHDLARAVVVGEHDSDVLAVQSRLDLLNLSSDCSHRAGNRSGLVHQLAALACNTQHGRRIKDAGSVKRSDLTVGVACDRIRVNANGLEQTELGERAGTDGGLGPLGAGQCRQLSVLGFLAKHAWWEDDLVQREGLVHVDVGGLVPSGERLGVGHGELSAHVQVLAALPWEEECSLALLLAHAVVDALWRREGLALALNERGGLAQLDAELLQIRGDDGDTVGGCSLQVQLAVLGQPRQQTLAAVHLCGNLDGLEGTDERLSAVCSHHEELVGGDAVAGGLHGAGVLLHGDVEVGATKAKAGHTGTAGVVAAANPGARPQVQVERGLIQVHLGVGALDLDGRRQHLVVQRHHGLEETSGARSGLGVANL